MEQTQINYGYCSKCGFALTGYHESAAQMCIPCACEETGHNPRDFNAQMAALREIRDQRISTS